MTKTITFHLPPAAADLRMIAFMLARSLRAIRADRLERAAELLHKTQDLVDRLTASDEKARASVLVENIATVGFMRQLELDMVGSAAA